MMDEKKFTICNLAMDSIILKIAALKTKKVKIILQEIKMDDEDLAESRIALELDDLYEYGVLQEPDDKDVEPLKDVIEAMMKELPNMEEYKKLYNWDI
ncbi:hypothetical protein LCGC14_1226800 [marine sediment metagenome]|uniref:Uncharacterized protein n=1 Tax=marine sediment metagenome TaxID=412755 RepID=A0A0F9LDQ8_9ZZZZ